MRDLFKKDIVVCKWYLLAVIGNSFAFGFTAHYFNLMLPLAVFVALALSFIFIGIDNLFNAEVHFCSLPIERKKIVYQRYLMSAIMTIAGLLLTMVVTLLFENLLRKTPGRVELIYTYKGIFAYFFIVILIKSYLLPFIFRYGFKKGLGLGGLVNMIFFVIVIILRITASLIEGVKVFTIKYLTLLVKEVIKIAEFFGSTGSQILLVFITAGIVFLSLTLSVRLYKKREF